MKKRVIQIPIKEKPTIQVRVVKLEIKNKNRPVKVYMDEPEPHYFIDYYTTTIHVFTNEKFYKGDQPVTAKRVVNIESEEKLKLSDDEIKRMVRVLIENQINFVSTDIDFDK